MAVLLGGCPTREDFLLVPDVHGASGACSGTPEVFTLAFDVTWANGDRADPVEVIVGAQVDVETADDGQIVAGRVLMESDGSFDGSLGRGEDVTAHYTAELEDPDSFDCADVCAEDMRLRVLYGIVRAESPTPPVANTETKSDSFAMVCGG